MVTSVKPLEHVLVIVAHQSIFFWFSKTTATICTVVRRLIRSQTGREQLSHGLLSINELAFVNQPRDLHIDPVWDIHFDCGHYRVGIVPFLV